MSSPHPSTAGQVHAGRSSTHAFRCLISKKRTRSKTWDMSQAQTWPCCLIACHKPMSDSQEGVLSSVVCIVTDLATK